MYKNKFYCQSLLLIGVLWLFSSCSNDSRTINIVEDNFSIEASVMKDSLYISTKGDTSYIPNGLYVYSDSIQKITAEFTEGVLDGILTSEGKGHKEGSKFTGYFKKEQGGQPAKDEYIKFFKRDANRYIHKKFKAQMGVPDGKHTLYLKDIKLDIITYTGIIREAFFLNGKPEGIWKQYLHDGLWEEVEFKEGEKLKSKQIKDNLIMTETFYVNNSKSEGIDYEYDENSNVIKKEILNYDNYKLVIEHYNSEGEIIKKIADDKEYIYENGVEIGVVVKEFLVSYPYLYGLRAMEVPVGKIWTPLYYEVSKAPSGSYKPPYLYPKNPYDNDSYLTKEGVVFPEKSDFISYKVSKQTFKPITHKKNFAVAAGSWEIGENTFHLYFLEEDAN